MDIKKNRLKIGKVRVDLYPKSPDEKNKFVVLKPDDNQSDESKEVAYNFLNNVFKSDSKYGSGIIQFNLNDSDGWKKKYGDKFIKAIAKSDINISWTGDPIAIKGLKALLPKGAQFGLDHGFGSMSPISSPDQGFSPSMSASQSFVPSAGASQSFKTPEFKSSQQNQPPEATSLPPENTSYIHDMKNLINLWEKINHEI